MKAQMIEKSGFPKPLGLLLILIIMGLLCLVQCVFSQPLDTTSTDKRLYYARVEKQTEIQIEAGMTEKSYLLNDYKFRLKAEESEPEVSLEPWMLNFEELELELADNDPELEIEEWMIDGSSWLNVYKFRLEAEESESEISNEPWMLNFELFELEFTYNDPEPEIEEWMIDDYFWNISTDSCNTQNEVWEEEIKLEVWMYDINYFSEVFFIKPETKEDK